MWANVIKRTENVRYRFWKLAKMMKKMHIFLKLINTNNKWNWIFPAKSMKFFV